MKSDEEKVKLATSAALIDGRGKINYADLITELNKEFSNTEYSVVEGDGTTSEWTIQITKNAVNYKITAKGSAIQTINWEQVLANATKHQDQSSTNPDIGVDMYGNPVNMDLWYYELNSEDDTIVLGKQVQMGSKMETAEAYKGEITTDGTIIGEIPQYVKSGEDVYILRSLYRAFYQMEDLVISPVIPSSVTDMTSTFSDCISLAQAPAIPSSVTNINGAFSRCTSLTQAPVIPSSVTNINGAFSGCTSLTQAPAIPSSVTNINGAFSGCTSLTQAPAIPSSVTIMNSTFSGCTSLTQALVLPESVTDLEFTFNYCTSLTEAPIIPNSVENMYCTFCNCISLITASHIPQNVNILHQTFKGCSALSGLLVIDSEEIIYHHGGPGYSEMLNGASTNEGTNLVVTGTCPYLDQIIATKSENSHITKGN